MSIQTNGGVPSNRASDTLGGKGRMFVGPRVDEYLNYVDISRNLSPTTLNYYRYILGKFRRHFVDTDVEKLTFSQLEEWMYMQTEQGLKPSSINTERATLRQFLRYCVMCGDKLTFDPGFIKNMKVQESVTEIMNPQEILEVAKKITNTKVRLCVRIMFEAGLRIGEVIKLEPADIYGREISVYDTKGGHVRMAFISQELAAELQDYKFQHPKGRLFPYGGKLASTGYTRYNTNGLRNEIKKNFKKLGYEMRPHVLRHSYATALFKGGADIYTVKELLGHSDVRTTQRYLHLTNNDLKSRYDKFFK